MFNLITTVICIALLAIMALATIWFGGSVHGDSNAKATYAGHMNAAQQIEGAMKLYQQDHGFLPDLQDDALLEKLVDEKYLNSVPEGGWKVQPGALYRPLYKPNEKPTISQCAAVNKVAGFDVNNEDVGVNSEYEGCPPCNGDIATPVGQIAQTYKQWPGCQFVASSGTNP